MAHQAIGQHKRLAMGETPSKDKRDGGFVKPRGAGGASRVTEKAIDNPKKPMKIATMVNGSDKPELESRAGVVHKPTDVGRRVGQVKGRP